MNRREFLQRSTALAGAAYLARPALAEQWRTLGEPNLTIGIVSDIHLRGTDTTGTFIHTLEYFRDRKVDGVIIAGDMADQGLITQLHVVADAWFKVFPDNKGLDGKETVQLFIYGNHDVRNNGDGGINAQRAAVWKECFGEDYKSIWMKTVKGYHFIGAHWYNENNIPGLAAFLSQHNSELSGEKPFFYIQHPHLKDTCNCAWAWGRDDGTVTKLLSNYPNAVAFSGHSHSPLDDDRDLWQGRFTSIGTSSLSYLYPMPGRENTYQDDWGAKPPTQMAKMNPSDGRQGMVMRVYDDAIAFERREFVYDESVGEDWILPWPINTAEPLSFDNRAKTAAVPAFPAGAKVTVTAGKGSDRYGNSGQQVTVHFPTVLKKNAGVRAFDYEVQVEYKWLDVDFVTATKRVFSPKCYLGETKDSGEVRCVYGESELPKDFEYRFAVRPCNCYGHKGAPIYSDWVDKSVSGMTSTIAMTKQFFKTGEAIQLNFQDAPVGTEAWVGIYAKGKNPGSGSNSLLWKYTDVAAGTLSLGSLSSTGEYYAVLFQDGGYSECSVRVPFYVLSRAYDPAAFSMTPDKTEYAVGEAIAVTLKNAPRVTTKDWIGIFPVDAVPKDSICPAYLFVTAINSTLTLNVSGNKNWTAALPEGEYYIGYFMNDGYDEPFARQRITIASADAVSAPEANAQDGNVYRLNGSLAADMTQPGIYVREGKKVLVR